MADEISSNWGNVAPLNPSLGYFGSHLNWELLSHLSALIRTASSLEDLGLWSGESLSSARR